MFSSEVLVPTVELLADLAEGGVALELAIAQAVSPSPWPREEFMSKVSICLLR